jgi:hypothetical protein
MARPPFVSAALALVAAGTAMYTMYKLAVRPYVVNWGATPEEAERPLPGDQMVPQPKVNMTHAITIEAPATDIWPWLVQIGSGRAGWYSYDRVDNDGVESARQILPQYQGLKVGDEIPMTADGKLAMPVAMLEPERYLVMGGTINTKTGGPGDLTDPALENYFSGTWALVLDEVGANTTRLLVRARLDWNEGLATASFYALEPGSFLMNRKMLLGIKERVEAARQP